MAGDWIKVEENTPDKPEVAVIASETGLDVDAVMGKLIRVWAWASRNCHGDGVTDVTAMSLIDRSACHIGFAEAMIQAEWLISEGKQLKFPNFDNHISSTAKDRGQAFIRKQRQRRQLAQQKQGQHKEVGRSIRDNCHAQSVTNGTEVSRSKRDKNVTIETKTETDNIISLSARAREDPELDLGDADGQPDDRQPASVVIPPCTQNEAEQFGAQTGIPGDLVTEWYDKHDANDWRPYGGNPPMTTKSWKYDLKNFWKNKKAKDDERRSRNQRNGAAANGKAPANQRNSHLTDGELDEYKRVSKMEDIRDALKAYPDYEFKRVEWWNKRYHEHPEYQNAIESIRRRNNETGPWNGVYTRLAEQKLIDGVSGRWIANDCRPGDGVG